MSDFKHIHISCDVAHCSAEFVGDPSESADQLRTRIASKQYGGWVSRPHSFPDSDDVAETWKDDFCPFHAYEVHTPIHTAAKEI